MGKISTIANYAEQLQLPQKHVLLNIIDLKVDDEMKEVIQSIRHSEERTDVKFAQVREQISTLDARIDTKFTLFEERTDAKFALFEERMNNMEERMDKRFEALEQVLLQKFNAIDIRFESLEKRFNMLLWMIVAYSTLLTAGFLKSIFF